MPPTTRLPQAVSSALRVAVIPVILAWVACGSEDGPRLDGLVTVSVRYEEVFLGVWERRTAHAFRKALRTNIMDA